MTRKPVRATLAKAIPARANLVKESRDKAIPAKETPARVSLVKEIRDKTIQVRAILVETIRDKGSQDRAIPVKDVLERKIQTKVVARMAAKVAKAVDPAAARVVKVAAKVVNFDLARSLLRAGFSFADFHHLRCRILRSHVSQTHRVRTTSDCPQAETELQIATASVGHFIDHGCADRRTTYLLSGR